MNNSRYTKKEELLNSYSHAAGIFLGLIAAIVLLNRCHNGDNAWAYIGIVLYIFGMLSSYITSTAYHAITNTEKKEKLRYWDHAAIYWHIAGSYSPFTLIALRQQGYWGWGLFLFIWGCAIAGTIITFHNLKEHSNIETLCFIGMGLSIITAFKPLIDNINIVSILFIIAEGVSYIIGAIFYTLNKQRYMHSIFHFFVLAGSICHIFAVWYMLIEYT